MEKPLKVYAAGITGRGANSDWIWQGTVVAHTLKESEELLRKWMKDEGIKGVPHVTILGVQSPTKRPKGVSHSMELS